jgi:hypothetical protein
MSNTIVAIGIAFLGYTLTEGTTMAETIALEADAVGTASSGTALGES